MGNQLTSMLIIYMLRLQCLKSKVHGYLYSISIECVGCHVYRDIFLREVIAMLGIAVAVVALVACYGTCVEIGHSDVWRVL